MVWELRTEKGFAENIRDEIARKTGGSRISLLSILKVKRILTSLGTGFGFKGVTGKKEDYGVSRTFSFPLFRHMTKDKILSLLRLRPTNMENGKTWCVFHV